MPVWLHEGDCLDILKTMPADSIHSIVTDPPYGLESMGEKWDGANGFRRSLNAADVERDNAFGRLSRKGLEYRAGHLFQAWSQAWATEALRVLKPGGHLLAFSSTRTYHRMVVAIEDSGFEIREQIGWLYGSGFPKSRNLDGEWQGWGTTLKPAWEPICMARKPFSETVAANVLLHGTGALNIDKCRVAINPDVDDPRLGGKGSWGTGAMAANVYGDFAGDIVGSSPLGRWPATVIHDGSDEVMAAFAVYGEKNGGHHPQARGRGGIGNDGHRGQIQLTERFSETGTAARFFYCAKASKTERAGSKHPTIKPLSLMRYLCKLVTPPGGVVLDPFAGSGTTGQAALDEGFDAILIEREAEYCADIRRRLVLFLEHANG